MRVIKFRFWNKDKKTFHEPLHSHFDSYFDGIEDIVQQFTGLLDKNGKEIYEGDIIKVENYDNETFIGEVKFRDGCFDLVADCMAGNLNCFMNEVLYNKWVNLTEVIGNIFENPEKLK